MHLDLRAVVTLDLDLVDAAGAVPTVSIVLSLRSKTSVMATNVFGWKPQSSGWCGSK
jgi:hypothetical protein